MTSFLAQSSGTLTGQRQVRRRAVFTGMLHFSEENLLQKAAGGVKHQKECPGVVKGRVQPAEKCIPLCPQMSLRAQDWGWEGGRLTTDQVLSSLSSLPTETSPVQEPVNGESFFSTGPCPQGKVEQLGCQ